MLNQAGAKKMRAYLIYMLALIVLLSALPARAQDDPTIARQLDVFVIERTDSPTSTIYFLDALSGLSTVINVENGHRFTLVGNYVLFEKAFSGAIMRANPDGTLAPHSFIRSAVDTASVDWVISPDKSAIAWVTVSDAGVSEAFTAWANGDDFRQLPITSPSPPQTLYPIALNNARTRFYFDVGQAPGNFPYPVYYAVELYNIPDERFVELPDEPNCPCGATFSADGRIFARLEATHPDEAGGGPFAVRIWDLPTNASFFIPAPTLDYRYAGDLLLNEFSTLAVYSVAAGVSAEANTRPEEYSLVLVDLNLQEQVLLREPGETHFRPVAFLDNDEQLLLVDAEGSGTYKLNLRTGELIQVSEMTYLGTIITAVG